jgi:hypothetical protein
MRTHEGRLIGILGTVIVHLLAAITFMSFRLSSPEAPDRNEFVIEIASAEETEEEVQMIELPGSSIEKILQGDEELLNIARNLANRPERVIDPQEYVDRVKEDLIKSGMLGEDNFIDEQKKQNETDPEANLSADNGEGDEAEEKNDDELEKMAADYQGPTRIYYDLKGRYHTYLPIPIYKCEGSGKVTLAIIVNQKGIVESAQVIGPESTTTEQCLLETAVRSALASRFNQDAASPKVQGGTISYHFVAQ